MIPGRPRLVNHPEITYTSNLCHPAQESIFTTLIDGKSLAKQCKQQLSEQIQARIDAGKRVPTLAVVLVGNDPASHIYVTRKREACTEIGMHARDIHYPADIDEATLITQIHALNQDDEVDGILVQLPLPNHIDQAHIIEQIDPIKDVDGFHPYNLGRLAQRRPLLRPCTPKGMMQLLATLPVELKGLHAVVVGTSSIVGRPMGLELLLADVTVTFCHRGTADLAHHIQQADILVAAIGNPNVIDANWIKLGAIVLDVGINRLDDGSISGDVPFDVAATRAAYITPVPGGVGPMTVASLLQNTLQIAENRDDL
ncbi:MAG: bifunctional protein FolD [marine bacterium B5-7]|nr:MAG: bifunctional protein FolD [marine bacterium B5-7]